MKYYKQYECLLLSDMYKTVITTYELHILPRGGFEPTTPTHRVTEIGTFNDLLGVGIMV